MNEAPPRRAAFHTEFGHKSEDKGDLEHRMTVPSPSQSACTHVKPSRKTKQKPGFTSIMNVFFSTGVGRFFSEFSDTMVEPLRPQFLS